MPVDGWCPGGGKQLDFTSADRERSRRVRCGDCNRLLMVRQTDCHGGFDQPCWHSWVPAHKVRLKKARRPSKRQAKTRRRA